MIRFVDVSKKFGNKRVLDNVSFEIKKGEIAFVIGKSGMGKSVLLKHIVGLLQPDSGEVWVDGRSITGMRESELFEVRKRTGMVFQFPALLDSLSVFENVAFGIRAHWPNMPREKLESIVKEKLALVNIPTDVLQRLPLELSFSMQKRVSIARTLALGPDYLLFDEPTTGMDPVVTTRINDLIFQLSRALGASALVVSHDMHCALSIADKIMLLHEGRIVVQGSREELIYSQHELAEDFLREAKHHLGTTV